MEKRVQLNRFLDACEGEKTTGKLTLDLKDGKLMGGRLEAGIFKD